MDIRECFEIYFELVEDPRSQAHITYKLSDILFMLVTDKECEYEMYTTIEKGHGRIEKRTCYVLNEVEFFTDYLANWKGLKKIFAVKREVEKDGKKTKEISCYLSSKNTTAEKLLSYYTEVGIVEQKLNPMVSSLLTNTDMPNVKATAWLTDTSATSPWNSYKNDDAEFAIRESNSRIICSIL